MHSIPMRLRDNTIGSLNLFRERVGHLNDEDALAAQALADVATIGILQHRIAEEAEITQAQLQNALDSRVTIEQAKGYLAHTQGIDMDAAFSRIRANARSTRRRLRDVATEGGEPQLLVNGLAELLRQVADSIEFPIGVER